MPISGHTHLRYAPRGPSVACFWCLSHVAFKLTALRKKLCYRPLRWSLEYHMGQCNVDCRSWRHDPLSDVVYMTQPFLVFYPTLHNIHLHPSWLASLFQGLWSEYMWGMHVEFAVGEYWSLLCKTKCEVSCLWYCVKLQVVTDFSEGLPASMFRIGVTGSKLTVLRY